jgi:hypothetical protein
LRIAFLRVDRRAIAMQLAIESGGAWWLFKIGFDESFARCSPGSLLMHTIGHAARSGLARYELLGEVEPWIAQLWTREEHPTLRVRTYPFGLRGAAALVQDGAFWLGEAASSDMSLRSTLRDARYALPGLVGQHVAGPDAAEAACLARWLARQGMEQHAWLFPARWCHAGHGGGGQSGADRGTGGAKADLALKAPHLALIARIAAIARAAKAGGVGITLDSHGPALADATLGLVEDFPAGCALPARWQRSMGTRNACMRPRPACAS